MVGKTFKGMTDELLRWQTGALLERETTRRGIAVMVRPELVVEITYLTLTANGPVRGGFTRACARTSEHET